MGEKWSLFLGIIFKSSIVLLSFWGQSYAMEHEVQLTSTDTGHLIVPVTIGKTKTYFIVDTGSSSSVIDADYFLADAWFDTKNILRMTIKYSLVAIVRMKITR
ncbi:MAG: hypothetical protein GY787_17645 [Alteromonadales bacterium]|nr:hypothetical protein [Alteromonadales bacterium]